MSTSLDTLSSLSSFTILTCIRRTDPDASKKFAELNERFGVFVIFHMLLFLQSHAATKSSKMMESARHMTRAVSLEWVTMAAVPALLRADFTDQALRAWGATKLLPIFGIKRLGEIISVALAPVASLWWKCRWSSNVMMRRILNHCAPGAPLVSGSRQRLQAQGFCEH